MNNLDKQYTDLLQDILDNGVRKEDRTGTGTISVFGRQIRHKMSEGFPLLTTKKMPFKTIVTELLWFLRGDTNIKFLVDNNCHIWDGDAYKNYEKWWKSYSPGGAPIPLSKEEFINRIKTDDEFAKKWGDLGRIYGAQWRSWATFNKPKYIDPSTPMSDKMYIDQIANLINDLKTNPDSRRLMLTAWNPAELDSMVLPPCHYGFQVYTRELSLEERLCIADKFNPLIREDCLTKVSNPNQTPELKLIEQHEWLDSLGPNVVPQRRAISLIWNQRSVDTFLGLPFNIASYGLLLEIIAKAVNMVPDELIGNLGDTHLYLNHIEQAKEQIGRELTDEERAKLMDEKLGVSERILPYLTAVLGKHKIPKRTREPYPLPTLNQFPTYEGTRSSIESYVISDFTLKDYQSHPAIKAPLSN
jgi:thymidylate synthase